MQERDTNAASKSRLPLLALYLATVVSVMGSMMTLVAIPWFVLQTTGSTTKTALASSLWILSVVVAGILGGPLVDRLGHKRASVVADIVSGLAIGAIPLLYHTVGLPFWALLVLVVLRGLADAPGRAARRSLVPDLAARAGTSLERANAVTQAIVNAALLVGPAGAGVLIALLGPSNVLWIDAGSYVLSAMLLAVAVPVPQRMQELGSQRATYRDELAAGLRYLSKEPQILTIFLIVVVMNLINEPLYQVVLFVYADRVLESPVDLGFLIAGYGVGSLLAALAYGAVGEKFSRRSLLIGSALLSIVPYGILVTLPERWMTLMAIVVAGVAAAPVGLMLTTLTQERVPEELRGRVFGLVAMTPVAIPIGVLIAGVLLEAAGLRLTLIVQGLASLVFAFVVFRLPTLKNLERAKEERWKTSGSPVALPQAEEHAR